MTAQVHLYVLIDRSGSMASMASDVIGGFNRLLADQAADGPDARMTLVQFDSWDPHEVIADAVPIAEIIPLSPATFQPRGGTPLLDATGLILGQAVTRAATLAAAGQPAEEIVVVTITDGHENQSREFGLDTIRNLVAGHRRAGWRFVFLGAGLDAYADARRFGYDDGSIQAFVPDADGARLAFRSLSSSTTKMRGDLRAGRRSARGDYFGADKPAEADRRRRRPDTTT